MRLPIQSQPVQRTIPSQPFANLGAGVAPSGCGVQPSGWLDSIKDLISDAVPVAEKLAPIIGSFF
jgi:hypothetical protein